MMKLKIGGTIWILWCLPFRTTAEESCVNASAVIVPKYAKRNADALGQRLGPLKPLPAADPDAVLSGFANPKMGEWIDQTLESDFAEKGAIDSTAPLSRWSQTGSNRRWHIFLRPTIAYCESMDHALSNREFLCPYASVVQVDQDRMLSAIGPTLVVTAITNNENFKNQLLAASNVERLNIGPIPQ